VTDGFANPIIGGGGNLQYPAIKSPNFVMGVSGWSIDKNGNAYFNSITLPAGAGGATVFVQGTAPTANRVNDLWVDTAAGNAIFTWTGAAWAAQQFGTGAIAANAITAALIAAGTVVAGIINGTTVTAATINGSTINGSVFNGADFSFAPAGLFFYSGTPAAGNLILTIGTTASGTDPFGNAFQKGNIIVYSGAATYTVLGSSAAGNLLLSAGSSGGAGLEFPAQSATPTSTQSILYADSNGNLSFRNGPSGFNGHLVNCLGTDTTLRGVTGGTAGQLSALFTIPAGDALAGTIYRLKLYGKFVQAATAEQTSVNAAVNGTAVAASGWVAATVAAGLGATWEAEFALLVVTAGSAGTATPHLTGKASTNGRPAQTAEQSFGSQATTAITLNTTVSNTLSITGNAVTSATITGIGSSLERLGA
jgi:hypothetical protein